MKRKIKQALRWLLLKPITISLIMLKYKCSLKMARYIYYNWYLVFKNY